MVIARRSPNAHQDSLRSRGGIVHIDIDAPSPPAPDTATAPRSRSLTGLFPHPPIPDPADFDFDPSIEIRAHTALKQQSTSQPAKVTKQKNISSKPSKSKPESKTSTLKSASTAGSSPHLRPAVSPTTTNWSWGGPGASWSGTGGRQPKLRRNTGPNAGPMAWPSLGMQWTGDGEQESGVVPVSVSGGAKDEDEERRGR
jgi:hypothetical protein